MNSVDIPVCAKRGILQIVNESVDVTNGGITLMTDLFCDSSRTTVSSSSDNVCLLNLWPLGVGKYLQD